MLRNFEKIRARGTNRFSERNLPGHSIDDGNQCGTCNVGPLPTHSQYGYNTHNMHSIMANEPNVIEGSNGLETVHLLLQGTHIADLGLRKLKLRRQGLVLRLRGALLYLGQPAVIKF